MNQLERVARAIQKQADYNIMEPEKSAKFEKEKPYWMDIAQAAIDAMPGWEPIETPPKDKE